jgi:hypothetical protein
MTEVSRFLVVILVVALLGGIGATGSLTAETPDDGADASPVTPSPNSLQDPSNESNDSADHHENPAELESDRDLSSVQSWLASEMGSRLKQSSSEIQEGEYESARRVLGDDYDERASQYRDVVEQMRGEPAGEELDSVRKVHDEQREFLSAVQTYETTYEKFEDVHENGSEERARRIARQLQEAEERVNNRSSSLVETYRIVSNNTEMNLSENERVTRNISENVSERQREIDEELFVQTELNATTESRTTSFTDPLVIRGQLRAENGSAIGNENVTFRVGNRTFDIRTNDAGGFSLEYAPTNLPANATEVTLEYVPDNESVFDTSNETLPVEIATTDPTLELTEFPDSVAFDEEVTVRGTVQADGKAISDVPVALFVEDEQLGNATTNSNGTFVVRGRLPADVSPNSTLRVSLPLENRTLTSTGEIVNVSIRRTDTSLTTNASHTDNETVHVAGRLTTDDGTPLDNRSVHVKMNGRTLAVVSTDRTGVYNATVLIPESLRDRENVTVEVTFDGSDTNLEPARIRESVSLVSTDGRTQLIAQAINAIASAPWWMFLIVGSVLVPITYGLAGTFGSQPKDREFPETTTDGAADSSGDADEAIDDELLAFAREKLAEGDPERATHLVYVAIRRELGREFGLGRPLTHWEFFDACRNAGLSEDRLEALRRVIQAEERVRFAATALPHDTAETALRAGSLVFGDEDSSLDGERNASLDEEQNVPPNGERNEAE